MQQPQTGYLGRLGREFIEAVDGGQDAGDGVGLFGEGWQGIGVGGSCVEGFDGVCHGVYRFCRVSIGGLEVVALDVRCRMFSSGLVWLFPPSSASS